MSKNKTLFDFFTSPKNQRNSSEKKTPDHSQLKSPQVSSKTCEKRNSGSTSKRARDTPPISQENAESEEKKIRKDGASSVKRRRLVIASDSDDSEEEYKPDVKDLDSEDELEPEAEEEEETKPKKKLNTSKSAATPKSRKKPTKVDSPGLNISSLSEGNTSLNETVTEKEWTHLTFEWLRDDKIRDKKGKPKSHPDYDPKTLYVPDNFKKNLTPAMRQWWEMKSDHFDTVLFFKVGKFYELYHMDAVIAVNELGLVFMKGDFAHSGFPEISYGRYSDLLVQKGYKVARVEQTETPQMMEERCRQMSKATKFDRVVSREICQITTKGTRTFSCQDGKPMGADNSFLIVVTELVKGDASLKDSDYGVCFIDTSVGKFHLGQFTDDRHCSRLRTVIAHYPPAEIIYEKDALSKKTLQYFNSSLGSVKKCPIGTSSKFWEVSRALRFLVQKKYFAAEGKDAVEWPEIIKNMLDEGDPLQETAKKEYELAMKAFSACVWYLKECFIEDHLLTMKQFELYEPQDNAIPSSERTFASKHMVLDGVTLKNLEILQNTSGDIEDTLIETIDFCSTNFGKRLLRQWLCSPLCDPKCINDRLDAIEDLESISHIVDDVVPLLKKLPDLERLLSRIHAQGLVRSKDHPDSRAIFYEEETYSKRKILSFLSALEGFKCAVNVISKLDPFLEEFKSSVLKQSLSLKINGGLFPELQEALDYFDTAFDHEQAKKEGCIIPSKGVDAEYDEATAKVEDTQSELEEYLSKQSRKFQCKASYFGSGRTRYQLEIPDSAAKKADHSYELQSQKKGFKRFYTSEIKALLAQLISAEERRDAALLDIMRRIFAKFDQNYSSWAAAVQCLSVFDVLISLTLYKKSCQPPVCRPQVVLPEVGSQPFLKIFEGRHPTVLKSFQGSTFIPNSVYLGPVQTPQEPGLNKGGIVVIVTGPNMGGKSMLMRQTALLIILAQLGSYIPAEKCIFTPVDRVFTRIGASDRITSGESTFFVEVSETSSILHHATSDSLVIIDELGRGTSTYDGTAIAFAVVKDLSTRIKCRTLFSTHYHSLVEDFKSSPDVGLGHMACMVEDDNNDTDNCALENITFLYKFKDGVCPKSYGFNVARLAGISSLIVRNGFQKAKEFERRIKYKKMCWGLLTADESNAAQRLDEARQLVNEDKKD